MRSDVLTILELGVLFDSVNYLDCSVWQDSNKIANSEPAILIDDLCSLLRILEVALHDTVAFDVEFASWRIGSGVRVKFR